MPDAITAKLLSERESIVARSEAIKISAVEEQRDLSDQDKAALLNFRERIKNLDEQLDITATGFALDADVAERIARWTVPEATAPVTYRSAGELLWDMLHMGEAESRRRYEQTVKRAVQQGPIRLSTRAAQHMGTTAAATTPTAGGFDGLIVASTVGPVIDLVPSGRPFLTALGVRPAPASFTFMRPRIVDPDFATGVGVQTLQKAELASKKFDIAADPLVLTTVGGYLNISQQLLSFVAGSLDIILGHMNKRLAAATERAAVAELANSAGSVTLAADADAAAIIKAFYDASALVFETTGELAQWVLMGPQGWARLGSLVDAAGRPLFPWIGPANAVGTASADTFVMAGPAGLTPVVSAAVTDATYWVGNSLALESYEYRYPLLEAVEPSLLGRQIAVAASTVNWRAVDDGAVHLAP